MITFSPKMLCHHFFYSHILYIVKLQRRFSRVIPNKIYVAVISDQNYTKLGSLGDPMIIKLQYSDYMRDTPTMMHIGMRTSHVEH